MEGDLVSVIIPSFNRGPVLERAVRSALEQTYPNTEIIVVDDGSTDDTLPRLERIESRKLKVLSTGRNVGPGQARNLGIVNSAGAYLAFLDSDDSWEPWKLEAQLACFEAASPEVGVVYCGRCVRLADGSQFEIQPRYRGDVFEVLRRRNSVALPTIVVKRSVFRDVGVFDAHLPACEDWELVLRMARHYAFDFIADAAVMCDGTGGDRVSDRTRAVFIANHHILRRFSGRRPSRDVLAAYLAIQSRELLRLGQSKLAGRYALKSLRLEPGDEERIALRTLRQLMVRRRFGRVLVQAYNWRNTFSWRQSN